MDKTASCKAARFVLSQKKYYTCDQMKDDEMDGACVMYEAEEKCTQKFSGKCEGHRPLQRPRCTWRGYKTTRLNFFLLPCKLGNRQQCVVLACALLSIHDYNFEVVRQTDWQ
jgi:hypothetical protein